MTTQEARHMIENKTLIPAQPWDLFILMDKEKIINHGLKIYVESFHSEEIEEYTLCNHLGIHEWGKLTSKLLPWLDAGKIWIHHSEREITSTNDPEYIKMKKQKDKIKKTGSYEGPIQKSII